ncbi:MAG: tetratricopeptide repeat protein [Alphaproteobacteria bacterium]
MKRVRSFLAPRAGGASLLPWLRLSSVVGLAAFLSVAVIGACAQSDNADNANEAALDDTLSDLKVAESDASPSGFGDYLAGRYAYANHDITAAAEFMRRALESDPGDRALLQRAVTLLVADGRIDDARELAPRLIEADPSSRIAHLLLVVDDVQHDRLSAAKDRLKDIPRDGVYALLVPTLEAWIEFAEGGVEPALVALQPLARRQAYSGYYNFQAGLIADAGGDIATAETHYVKSLDTSPGGSLRAVQAYGSMLERTDRREVAEALYANYLKENPDSVWLETVEARLKSGGEPPPPVTDIDHGIAEALFDAASAVPQESGNDAGLLYARLALKIRPDFDVARMLIGETFDALNRPEDALAMYESIAPDSPFIWTARLRAAADLAALERVDEAVEKLNAAIAERPDRADAAITLGDVLRQAERYREAAEAYDVAFSRIHEIEQRHWSLYYVRGISNERIKNWQRAEDDFLRALELEPDQPLVLNYLGYSWVEQGTNLDRALQMIERAVELRPNDPYIIDSLGWALYQLGDYEGAVRNLEKSVELLSNDPIINDHLGDAYWQAGRKAEARFQWERSLALGPDEELAAKVRLKLSRGLAADAEAATNAANRTVTE